MCAKKKNICMATLLQKLKKTLQKNPQALDFNP